MAAQKRKKKISAEIVGIFECLEIVKNKMHRVYTPQISSKTTKHDKLNNIYI